ncbi:MAG: hypothetical protein JKY37_18920 [Nannocystaceae bacterium]|nr:hypothetical protein [Nannocystaceae bacterium]
MAGMPLLAVRVPARRRGAPKVLCCANIHGPELVATEVALGLLAALDGGVAAPLRETAEVWIAPSLNPDGHRRTFELGGDAALSRMRTNDRGVDLNRNYPLPGGRARRTYGLPGAGSTRPGEATYIGESPLSEPETAAIDRLAREQGFVASANLHSFMGTVIPARVTDRGCYRHYQRLCRALSAAQPMCRYRRVANRIVDVFTGEQEDHQHHNLDCWAACIETFSVLASFRQHIRAPTTFWRFNPRVPAPWVENDVPGLVAFFRASLALPRPTEVAALLTSSRTGL